MHKSSANAVVWSGAWAEAWAIIQEHGTADVGTLKVLFGAQKRLIRQPNDIAVMLLYTFTHHLTLCQIVPNRQNLYRD